MSELQGSARPSSLQNVHWHRNSEGNSKFLQASLYIRPLPIYVSRALTTNMLNNFYGLIKTYSLRNELIKKIVLKITGLAVLYNYKSFARTN
jgi:hypothetical protein